MDVSKAIELLDAYLHDYVHRLDKDFDVAVRLGLKALRRHQDRDYLSYAQMHDKLDGED